MSRHVADTSPTILLKFVMQRSYFDCILDAPHNLFTSVQVTVVYTDTNSMESDDHLEVDDVFPTGTLLKKRSRDHEEEERNQEEGTSQSHLIQSSKKAKSIKVSPEEESEILDWLKEHRELYAKKSVKYLDTACKARIINAKADEMGISRTYSELFCAYHYLI